MEKRKKNSKKRAARPPTSAWKKFPAEQAVVTHEHSASGGTPELPIISLALWPHLVRVTLPTGSRKDGVSSPILGVKWDGVF
jgi:hypothetical protein